MNIDDIESAIAEHTKAIGGALEEQRLAVGTLKEHFRTLEQKLVEEVSTPTKSRADGAAVLAGELLKNDMVQAVARKASTRTSIEIKASQILGLKNTIAGAGFFNSESGGVATGLERRRFVSSFLNTVQVSQGSIAWTRETGFTNAAGIQASEGALKPESALTFELNDTPIPTLAHWLKASNQVLSDQPELLNLISGRLRYGLNVLLDSLIIGGAGTGWTAVGNHTAFTPTAGESGLDSINRALALLESNEAAASLVILNPADYRALQRVKAVGGDGAYLYGQPAGTNSESIWGVPVLPNNSVAAGKLIVVDTARQGTLYVRENARLDIGYDGSDFTSNLSTLRVECRMLNVVSQPDAVAYGNLSA